MGASSFCRRARRLRPDGQHPRRRRLLRHAGSRGHGPAGPDTRGHRARGGGDPTHLLETLRASGIWRAMLEAYERGGVIDGSCAGAMVVRDWVGLPPSWEPRQARLGLVRRAMVMRRFQCRAWSSLDRGRARRPTAWPSSASPSGRGSSATTQDGRSSGRGRWSSPPRRPWEPTRRARTARPLPLARNDERCRDTLGRVSCERPLRRPAQERRGQSWAAASWTTPASSRGADRPRPASARRRPGAP